MLREEAGLGRLPRLIRDEEKELLERGREDSYATQGLATEEEKIVQHAGNAGGKKAFRERNPKKSMDTRQ